MVGFSYIMEDLSPMSVSKENTTPIDLIDELIGESFFLIAYISLNSCYLENVFNICNSEASTMSKITGGTQNENTTGMLCNICVFTCCNIFIVAIGSNINDETPAMKKSLKKTVSLPILPTKPRGTGVKRSAQNARFEAVSSWTSPKKRLKRLAM